MRTLLGRQTPVTTVLLVVIAVIFLVDLGTDHLLFAFGADQRSLVLAGQWWRPLTSMFLHGGWLHLLSNGWALYQLGAVLELMLGSRTMLNVYLLSGLAGSFASMAWRDVPSVGASGAIFGIMGALIGFLLRRRAALSPSGKSLLQQLVLMAGINVYIGWTIPQIDLAAHFGGFVAGVLLGLIVKERQQPAPPPRYEPDPGWPPA